MRLYQKPSGIWVVDYVCPLGERRRVSTGTRDKSAAQKQARALASGRVKPIVDQTPQEQALRPQQAPKAAPGWTMDRLWKHCEMDCWHPRKCRSQASIASNLKTLRSMDVVMPDGSTVRFADLDPTVVRFSTLKALIVALEGKGYANGTVHRKMAMVGKSLRVAAQLDLIVGRPEMPTLITSEPRTRVLSRAEEVTLFKAVANRVEAEPHRDWQRYGSFLRFLIDTGCRLGEALACRTDWLEPDGDGWTLKIPASITKSGKARDIPLTPAIIETLPQLRVRAVRERLFPYTQTNVQYMWRINLEPDLAALGVDISDLVLHGLRHTCLTRLSKRVPIHIVQRWAGHSDISITASTYVHVDTADLKVGLAALA